MECTNIVLFASVPFFKKFKFFSSFVISDGTTFSVVAGLLRLFTKYHVDRLREEVIRGLSISWPTTLLQWDAREARATDATGVYAPRHALPHPMYVLILPSFPQLVLELPQPGH